MLARFFMSERNIMVAILINAAVIFAMYFPQYYGDPFLERIDHLFLMFFTIEALVKMYVLKPRKYFEIGWNRFDLVIVLLSLPSLLVHVIPVPDTSLIIILRLFRLVRLIRFIRFIPNLNSVINGLVRAMKSSVFVLLALFFLNFLFAVTTCHFFAQTAPEYFGNPLIASYTIFQLFTVEGWHEVSAAVLQEVDNPWLVGLARLYFVGIVLIGGIFGMSLANAVFVDEMTIDNTQILERKIDVLQQEILELKDLIRKNQISTGQ